MQKGKIFISYRQSDTQSEASRLKEDLEEVFGEENVFFDIETLEPGLNFADAIEKTIRQSKVVLVLIGPDWADVKDDEGNLRIFQENDWVRREVAMALTMEDTRVIPVLLKKAILPKTNQLPDNIKSLAEKHSKEITISRWRYDVGMLIKSIEGVIPPIKKKEPAPAPRPYPISKPPKSWWAKNYIWILGVFVVLLILIISSEDFQEGYQEGLNGSSTIHDENISQVDTNTLREENPANPETEVASDTNDETPPGTAQEPINVQGNWVVYSNGQRVSTFVMSQYPEEIQFLEYDVNATNVGVGTGTLTGKTLYLDYYNSYYDSYGEFILKTENGGRSWEGKMKVAGSNQELTASLKRN